LSIPRVGSVNEWETTQKAVSSIVLGVRAWRRAAWPRWTNVIVMVAPLCATVPVAPLLVAAHFPNELLHVFFFAGPFALAVGNWKMRPVATRTNA